MNELKEYKYLNEDFYAEIRNILQEARKRVYRSIQSEMVIAYWEIGKMIVEKQNGESRAKYGDGLILELSTQLTKDFGKGFTTTNLKDMRKFYKTFKKSRTVCDQLSWSHYRLLGLY